MNGNGALIAGASGLVGQALIGRFLADNSYSNVIALGRTNLWEAEDRVAFLATNFIDFPNISVPINTAFCALGTTMKKAGSKKAFREVDHDFVINYAVFCKSIGVDNFVLVSSIGANPKSLIFYNRIKGQVEQSIKEMSFNHLQIYRPSLLIGQRQETRTLEQLGQAAYRIIGKGRLRRFLGTPVEGLADRMIDNSLLAEDGVQIFSY